jgi:predicted Zn-dependent peptidase
MAPGLVVQVRSVYRFNISRAQGLQWPAMTQIHHLELPNGLHLVAQPMPGVQSLAMAMLLPAGCAQEPDDQQGVAALLSEMICRGAGDLDARHHCDALDQLGVQRGASAESTRLRISATMIGSKRSEALPLLLDMALRPQLPADGLEPARDLALQSIEALEDEPQQKVFFALREKHHPRPFGRSPLGQRDHLEHISLEQITAFHRRTCVPGGTVIGVAGHFDWDDLAAQIQQLTADWQGRCAEPSPGIAGDRGYTHLSAPTEQMHIGLAYDAIDESDDNAFLQKAAVAVLSGGMSGRLFTEVREKRGLCYAVYAAYNGQRHRSSVLSYAGTTAARAQETLDVLVHELKGLDNPKAAITQSEFDRAVVGMKSSLVMQGESSGARASAIASDQVQLGRPRTLEELTKRIDSLTRDKLQAFIHDHPPGRMTLVTIGPKALDAGAVQ